jgi:hypothetical protein
MAANAEQIIQRYNMLKSLRGTWDSHWREIAELVYPRRDDFDTKRSPGEKRMTKVFDSTAIQANELLASGMVGLNINPATTWFRPNTDGMDEESKEWLHNAADVMLNEINSPTSGFYTAAYEYFLEFGAFGTAGLFITEGEENNGLLFQSRALSEISVTEGPTGQIDTVYRRFEWPIHRIFQRWGDKSGKSVLKHMKEKKLDAKFFIIHAIQPRKDRDKEKKDNQNLPFEDVYILQVDGHILEESGYHEFPLPVGRFYKSPMEVYGRSPAMTALPDVKMLNEVMKTTIKAAQKAVDPPLILPSDGFINPVRTVPGGVNVFDGSVNEAIGQFPSTNPGIGLDMVEFLANRIRSIFFVDQLQFAGGPQMTATEVLQRTEEKLRLMGPILGRVQTEFLGPVLDRVFGLLFRQGKFGAPPASLPESFEFEYTSQVNQAQRQQEANGFLRAVEVMSPMLNLQPELLLDNIDGDKTLRDTFEMFGFSPNKFTDEKERDTIRQQRAQIQQLSQTIEGLKQAGEAGQAINAAQAPEGV